MIIPIWTKGKMGIVTGVFVTLFALVFIVIAFAAGSNDTIEPQTYDFESMQTGKLYDLGDTYIIDEFATSTYNDDVTHYYLAGNLDESDELRVYPLSVREDSDVYEKCKTYIDDDSAKIGDLILPVVASVGTFNNTDAGDDIADFYEEALPHYTEVFEFTPVKDLQMTYLFATPDGLDAYNSSNRGGGILLGIFGVAALAAGLFLIIRNSKKKVPAAAVPAQPYAQQPYQQVPQQATFTPYQAAPQRPYQQAPQQTPYQEAPPQQQPPQPDPYTQMPNPFDNNGAQ